MNIRTLWKRLWHPTPPWPSAPRNAAFEWAEDWIKSFHRRANDPQAKADELPLEWVVQAIGRQPELWNSLDRWWTRFPSHFVEFWNHVQERPRQPWNAPSLTVVARHLLAQPETRGACPALVATAAASGAGRMWLLDTPSMRESLKQLSDESLQEWARATTYSMQHVDDAFAALLRLRTWVGEDRIQSALDRVETAMNALDATDRSGRAWRMTTVELDHWMDTDTALPYWFDPVNRQTWIDVRNAAFAKPMPTV